MATNIKIKKILKNSNMNRFQWKWIFTGSKTCWTIWRPCWFAMVAILNPNWQSKYTNPPIWAKFCFKSPLFCFHDNCGKVCPTNTDFFGLSRSTHCGCCSYQVSSISVWRVTCYDHCCVFQFFSILAVSMATAAILKKSTLKAQLHMAYDIPTRFHKV